MSFKKIFQDLFPLLWKYSWNITKDKEESEDIALKTLVTVWSNMPNFKSDLELKKFAYVATKNASINYLKKARTKNKHIAQLQEPTVSQDELEILTYRAALVERIHQKVCELPPRCQVIFTMCYLKDKPRHEVAKELNLSIDTVNSQCRIAINKLKSFFNP